MKTVLTTAFLICTLFYSTVSVAQKKEINTKESSIKWIGKKVTGSHEGTLHFSSGFLTFDDNNAITAGEFVVDMKSLAVTDLEAGKGKEKLEGHLSSEDFFGIAKHATSKLVITKAEKKDSGYDVTADLTIKGQTHPVSFVLTLAGQTANATVSVNRTSYGIRYGSGSFFDNLGDKAISDDFELQVALKM